MREEKAEREGDSDKRWRKKVGRERKIGMKGKYGGRARKEETETEKRVEREERKRERKGEDSRGERGREKKEK